MSGKKQYSFLPLFASIFSAFVSKLLRSVLDRPLITTMHCVFQLVNFGKYKRDPNINKTYSNVQYVLLTGYMTVQPHLLPEIY
jgi:hypothetical protein